MYMYMRQHTLRVCVYIKRPATEGVLFFFIKKTFIKLFGFLYHWQIIGQTMCYGLYFIGKKTNMTSRCKSYKDWLMTLIK